jgi:hypothetical protein
MRATDELCRYISLLIDLSLSLAGPPCCKESLSLSLARADKATQSQEMKAKERSEDALSCFSFLLLLRSRESCKTTDKASSLLVLLFCGESDKATQSQEERN